MNISGALTLAEWGKSKPPQKSTMNVKAPQKSTMNEE